MDIHALFLILDEMLSAFHFENDVSCDLSYLAFIVLK